MHALLDIIDIIDKKFDSTFKGNITPALFSDKEEFKGMAVLTEAPSFFETF
jgi:uncharacterized protein YgbK (DUF1537 family)